MRTRWISLTVLVVVLSIFGNPLYLAHETLAAGTGTLRMTLRGCPDGVDPTTIGAGAAKRQCDVPLDAPDDAFISYGGDGQGGEEVRFLDRGWDGTYEATVPANQIINLIGFEPEVRDSYAMTPVQDRDRDGNFDVRIRAGRTLTVRVYYYNSLASSGGGYANAPTSNSATVNLTFRGCPDNVDATSVNPFEVCTIPLDAPDASVLVWEDGGGVSILDLPRQYDGTYQFLTPVGVFGVALVDIAPVLRDAYVIYGANEGAGDAWAIYLSPGEVRDIWIFYYYS